jgi:hypothetical protein
MFASLTWSGHLTAHLAASLARALLGIAVAFYYLQSEKGVFSMVILLPIRSWQSRTGFPPANFNGLLEATGLCQQVHYLPCNK